MITATQCTACSRTEIPPRDACIACGASVRPCELEPTGRVLARTRYPGRDPIALVELDEHARVLARASGPGSTIAVGDEVEVAAQPDGFTIRPLGDG